MYLDDFSIKEVNTYYARRGGIRTANVKGYANVGSFSGLMQRAAAQAGRAAQTATDVAAAERDSQAAGTRSTAPRNTAAQTRSALYDAADARQAINSSSARQTDAAAAPPENPPHRMSPPPATHAVTSAIPPTSLCSGCCPGTSTPRAP